MANAKAETPAADSWAGAIRQRRKALVQRLGMAAACALVFSPLLGWSLGVSWVLGYFAIQLIDLWIFSPVNSGRAERLQGLRRFAGDVILVVNAGYFGSLAVPLWIVGGPMGGICAVMMLSAGAIYSMINAPRSTSVLVLTVTPQFLYLASTPFFMAAFGASPAFLTAASIAVAVFIAYCLSTWQRMNQARVAETAARVQADEKRAAAERIMEGRSAFLAIVGHDLRTPISAILTGSAELERGAADGSARAQARLISDAGYMMKALLDDLLDHAKLEAGHLTVETVDFNLRDLLNQTARLWRGPTRAKGLKLRVEGAAMAPAAVRGDPMRLRQVLNNLISNAVKFTAEGSITLRITAWPEDTGGHALLIEVSDTGPGMSDTQLGRLFTPFDQTADGVSARHGGTGLGLAISRQLAELMDGRLTARSAPGQGASFTLALRLEAGKAGSAGTPEPDREGRNAVARALSTATRPSAQAGPPAPSRTREAVPQAQPTPSAPTTEVVSEEEDRPMRVLVVDDHDINRRAIQLILQPLGCDIATAADGMAALKICETSSFDLIFMDVRMPELDGRETTRRIRAGGGPNAAAPIIAVTADTAPEDIAACTEAGMTYFVPKPITAPMLLGAVNHVMTMVQAEDEAETAAA
ncbi:MAG: response regulator [Alphaproteobacteria bacterium]|nr:response regulator [Alphaproteobacteria bacterium]MBU2419681.1 response regulator [Alphaproteobacteria bacterium]